MHDLWTIDPADFDPRDVVDEAEPDVDSVVCVECEENYVEGDAIVCEDCEVRIADEMFNSRAGHGQSED